jgi:hypothetical protein
MKINITVHQGSIGLQVFDRYYAYRQSLNRNNQYLSDISINFTAPKSDAINVAYSCMPQEQFCNPDDYDLILLENAGEPLEVATPYIATALNSDKTYFMCGAFLEPTHPLIDKIIPYNHNIRLFHDSQTRGFYPQYYDRALNKLDNKNGMCFINGANRSWRNYFIDQLQEYSNTISIRSSLTTRIAETPDCQFEDTYDKTFREIVNTKYQTYYIDNSYYDNGIKIGINSSHGSVPPGYFLLDEYYQHHCVIFPETAWINNQLFMTEKIFKCFVSKSIPFPIGGANIHRLYNQYGYQTAWNLLPVEHQAFDSILDHVDRYQQIIEAIQWLDQHNQVFLSETADNIREQNQNNFFKNTLDIVTIQKLDLLFSKIQQLNE